MTRRPRAIVRHASVNRPCTRPVLALLIGLAVVAPAVSPARSESDAVRWMTGDEIRREFTDSAVAGTYASGEDWTERMHADGTTDYADQEGALAGKWWIDGLHMCFSYPRPDFGTCFRVVRVGANCYEQYDFGAEPGAESEEDDLASRWSGRLWHSDRPATCEDSTT